MDARILLDRDVPPALPNFGCVFVRCDLLAWCSARISREQLLRQEGLAKPIRDTAWKAQERLCRRYRKLARAGKSPTVVTTAIARELAGFAWAIAKHVQSADA